jgi:hypothetical protein
VAWSTPFPADIDFSDSMVVSCAVVDSTGSSLPGANVINTIFGDFDRFSQKYCRFSFFPAKTF